MIGGVVQVAPLRFYVGVPNDPKDTFGFGCFGCVADSDVALCRELPDCVTPSNHLFHRLALEIGDQFYATTHNGRHIVNAKVIRFDTDGISQGERPYFVEWFDITGKHYEWFGLQEFKQIMFTQKEF